MKKEIKLSNTDRIMLANQFRILAILETNENMGDTYVRNAAILESKFSSHYHLLFEDDVDEITHEVFEEVLNIWGMFKTLNKQLIALEHDLNPEVFSFYGFHDSTKHYHVYRFLRMNASVRDTTQLWRYRNKSQNSLDCYREMLDVYNGIFYDAKDEQNIDWDIEKLNLLVEVISKYNLDGSTDNLEIAA